MEMGKYSRTYLEKWQEESGGETYGNGLIVKRFGRVWKAKRHSGKEKRHSVKASTPEPLKVQHNY